MSRADRECPRWVQSELPRLKRSVRPCHPPRPSSPIAILYPQGGRSTSAMQPKIGLRPFPAPGDERRTLAACRETPRQGDDDGPALALQKRSGRVAEDRGPNCSAAPAATTTSTKAEQASPTCCERRSTSSTATSRARFHQSPLPVDDIRVERGKRGDRDDPTRVR